MKNNFLSYMGKMIAIYALIAFLPLEYSMIIGAAFFSVAVFASSFGSMAIMSGIGILMFSLFSADFLSGVLVAISFIVPGIIQGVMVRRRKSLSSVVALTATARGSLLLAYYNRISNIANASIKDMLIGEAPDYLIEKFSEEGVPAEVLDIIPEMVSFAEKMIPSAIVISALSFAFLSLGCTKLFAKKMPFVFSGMRKLSDIKLDISFVAVTLITVVITFFTEEKLLIMLLNCLYVFYVIYFAAGFTFTYRLIKKGIKSRGASFLLTVIIAVFSFGLIMPVMGVVGAFFKTDYEKFIENKENKENKEIKKDEERKED